MNPQSAGRARAWAANIVLFAIMLVWVGAFIPEPRVLCTIPGLLVLLFVIERSKTTRRAIGWITLFGAIGLTVGYSWLAQTVQDFGGIPVVPSWVLTALFGVVGVAHGIVLTLFYRPRLARGRRLHPLSLVLLLVAVETLPIRFFPWMVGHGAVDVPPLVQSAEWGGVPGVSFVLLCLIVPIYEWLYWAFARSGPKSRPRAALVTFCIGLALYGWGAWRYDQVREEERRATESGKFLRVGIVQPNWGSLAKRSDENKTPPDPHASMRLYEEGSKRAKELGAELIVWPETAITHAIPMDPERPRKTDGVLANAGYRWMRGLGADTAFLVGMYERIEPSRKRWQDPLEKRVDERHNVAALRQPGGIDAPWSVYRKLYLIPFGEAMPLGLPRSFLPQDFYMLPGPDGQGPLEYKGLRFVPFLCYEGILPEHVLDIAGEERPDVLMSLTNDSWFGDTWEPYQHLNFTRFRAVEHRAPMVRATNTGISAFVSASGDVEARLELFDRDVLVRPVPLVERSRTIYARFGRYFPIATWIFALLAFFTYRMRPPPIID